LTIVIRKRPPKDRKNKRDIFTTSTPWWNSDKTCEIPRDLTGYYFC
jgi:hypothetical protein